MAFDYEKAKAKLQDREVQKKEEKRESGKGESIRWWSIPQDAGSYTIRFLLPDHEGGIPGTLVSSHRNLPVAMQGDPDKVVCFRMFGKECGLCKLLEDYDGRINTEQWRRNTRSYHNVLIVSDSITKDVRNDVPYLMGSSDYNYDWLIGSCSDPNIGDITDLFDGSDVKFTRKIKGGAFDRQIARKSRPVVQTEQEGRSLLSQCYDCSKVWKEPDDDAYKKLQRAVISLKQQLDDRLKSKDNFVTSEHSAASARPASSDKDTKSSGIKAQIGRAHV